MLKVEFHAHTNYLQPCEGKMSPNELIDTAKMMGYDALAITEHYNHRSKWDVFRKDPLKTYYDFKDYAKEKGVLLIPGTEVQLKEGEVLLINFTGDAKDYKTIKDLDKVPKSTMIMAPHPFYPQKQCIGPALEANINLFDAIEYSHFYTKKINYPNEKAKALAEKYGKPLIGTSDVHRKFQLDKSYTLVDSKKDIAAIIDAVRHKKTELITQPLKPYLFTKLLMCLCESGLMKAIRTNI